ncbi:hypothetical protein BLOT_002153 [Blomia tropicalis]|nr:hypothetical protein BLOT_002153 [Blomia tropicalis]
MPIGTFNNCCIGKRGKHSPSLKHVTFAINTNWKIPGNVQNEIGADKPNWKQLYNTIKFGVFHLSVLENTSNDLMISKLAKNGPISNSGSQSLDI